MGVFGGGDGAVEGEGVGDKLILPSRGSLPSVPDKCARLVFTLAHSRPSAPLLRGGEEKGGRVGGQIKTQNDDPRSAREGHGDRRHRQSLRSARAHGVQLAPFSWARASESDSGTSTPSWRGSRSRRMRRSGEPPQKEKNTSWV